MISKNLAVNVLTWNDWKNTIICLESIYQSNYDNFDIILIDNNSDKSHLEKIYDWSKNNIQVEDEEFKFNQHKKIDIIEVDKNFKISTPGEKKIYLIKNKTNVGLTAGLNIGYKFSVNQNYLPCIQCHQYQNLVCFFFPLNFYDFELSYQHLL